MEGFYYLHENGSLLFKKFPPEAESPFVKKIWAINTDRREGGWIIVLEATANGASLERIKEMMSQWKMDEKDFVEFLKRAPKPSPDMKKGLEIISTKLWGFSSVDAFYNHIFKEYV